MTETPVQTPVPLVFSFGTGSLELLAGSNRPILAHFLNDVSVTSLEMGILSSPEDPVRETHFFLAKRMDSTFEWRDNILVGPDIYLAKKCGVTLRHVKKM